MVIENAIGPVSLFIRGTKYQFEFEHLGREIYTLVVFYGFESHSAYFEIMPNLTVKFNCFSKRNRKTKRGPLVVTRYTSKAVLNSL